MNWIMELCRKTAGKVGFLFLALASMVIIVHYWPGFNEEALALYIRDKGTFGIFLYIAITAIGSALGVPRQGLSFAGGYAFGAVYGGIFATIGTTLGCAGSFFITRYFGKPFVPKRFEKRMERLNAFVAAAPFSATLTVRCLPIGNNALTNIFAGVSSIPPFGFIAGSFVGYIPQNFIFSLLGSGMRVNPLWRVLIAATLFTVALGVGAVLFRRNRARLGEEAKCCECPDTEG